MTHLIYSQSNSVNRHLSFSRCFYDSRENRKWVFPLPTTATRSAVTFPPCLDDFVLPDFQSVEHLSWLGLFKDLSEGTPQPSPFYHKRTLHKTRKECEHVREKFLQMRQVTPAPFLFLFFICPGSWI